MSNKKLTYHFRRANEWSGWERRGDNLNFPKIIYTSAAAATYGLSRENGWDVVLRGDEPIDYYINNSNTDMTSYLEAVSKKERRSLLLHLAARSWERLGRVRELLEVTGPGEVEIDGGLFT